MGFLRFIVCFAIALAVIFPAAMRVRPRIEAVDVGVDDANIFFVYARNVADGRGFVWNPNSRRVEGFSSPMWLLLITPFFAVSTHPEPHLFMLSVIVLASGLAVVLSLLTGSKFAPPTPSCSHTVLIVSLAAAWLLWCLTQPMFIVWTTQTLMETGLWCVVVLLGTAVAIGCATRRNPASPPPVLWLATPLILLARPEGMMLAGVLLAAESAAKLLRGKPLRAWARHTVGSLLIYGIALGAITAFRLLYFGYPLPNTYYAKVSPDRAYTLQCGWDYFIEFARSHAALPVFALIALLGSIALAGAGLIALVISIRGKNGSSRDIPSSVIAACISSVAVTAGLLAPILVGGDHFDGFRFYQPIWPLLPLPALFLILLAADRLAANRPHAGRWAALVFGVSALIAGFCFFRPDTAAWQNVGKRRLVDEFRLARDGRELGRALNRVFAETPPEVGAIAVGGIQFTYSGPVNDLMGLSNIEMAHHPGERKGIKNHAAFSKEVFYRQQPAVMVPAAFPADARPHIAAQMPRFLHQYLTHRWVLGPLQGLPRDPEFRRLYVPALVSRADATSAESIGAFYRRDFLESLTTNANYVVAVFDS